MLMYELFLCATSFISTDGIKPAFHFFFCSQSISIALVSTKLFKKWEVSFYLYPYCLEHIIFSFWIMHLYWGPWCTTAFPFLRRACTSVKIVFIEISNATVMLFMAPSWAYIQQTESLSTSINYYGFYLFTQGKGLDHF